MKETVGTTRTVCERTGPRQHSQSLRHPKRLIRDDATPSKARARSVDPVDTDEENALLGAGCLTRVSCRLQRPRRFSSARVRCSACSISPSSCSTSPDAPNRRRRGSQALAMRLSPMSRGGLLPEAAAGGLLPEPGSASPTRTELEVVSMLEVLLGPGFSAEQIKDLKAGNSQVKAPVLFSCSSISPKRSCEREESASSCKSWPRAMPETAKNEIAEKFINILS